MTQELIFDANTENEKKVVWWLYIAHGASLVLSLGALGWIPLIINYVKRGETSDTFLSSHHSWQIRSFWWYFFWCVIGIITTVILIGFAILFIAWLWKAYRLIKGFVDLEANKPMPM